LASGSIPTSTARSVRSSSQSIRSLGTGSGIEGVEPSLESALQFVGAHVPELRAGTGLRIRSVEGRVGKVGSAGTGTVR
jgi:hypothetical protein